MSPPLRSLAALALLIGATALGRAFRGVALDDPYVTYRYAANLLAGIGPVYNPGEPVLSTTALGYGLLLAALQAALAWLALPAISNGISAFGLGLLALALFRLCDRRGLPGAGLAAGGLVLGSPLLLSTFGLETCLFLGLIGWCAAQLDAGRPRAAALLAAGATVLRADGALAFAVLWLAAGLGASGGAMPDGTWRSGRDAARARAGPLAAGAGMYAAVVVPYQVALALIYGSPVPTTLAAKRAQATIAGWPDYLTGLAELLAAWATTSPAYWAAVPLAGLAVVALARWPWALPLVLWGAAQAIAYQLLGVASYSWYYAPLVPGAALGLALGATLLARRHALATLLLVLPLAWAQLEGVRGLRANIPEPRALAYQRAGEWLRASTPPDARIALMEVGIIGFYAERPMVDLLGLIRPATIEALQRQDFFWTIADAQPEYVVLTGKNPLWFQFPEPGHWFHQLFQPVERIEQAGFWGSPLTIYRRVAPDRVSPAIDGAGPGRFGDEVSLDRVVVERTRVRPGDFLTVQLFWRALALQRRDYAAFVHVVTAEPRVVAQHDTTVVATRWPVGRAVQYYHPMRLPADLPPGRYTIEVGLYDPARPLPADRLPPLDRPHGRNLAVIGELVVEG